jgi:hypothetical protein
MECAGLEIAKVPNARGLTNSLRKKVPGVALTPGGLFCQMDSQVNQAFPGRTPIPGRRICHGSHFGNSNNFGSALALTVKVLYVSVTLNASLPSISAINSRLTGSSALVSIHTDALASGPSPSLTL